MGLLSMILINSFAVIEPCMQIMTTCNILSVLLENCETKTLLNSAFVHYNTYQGFKSHEDLKKLQFIPQCVP